nr:MAG TPA: hypothetical protein [Caudoviricetes sp.]
MNFDFPTHVTNIITGMWYNTSNKLRSLRSQFFFCHKSGRF